MRDAPHIRPADGAAPTLPAGLLEELAASGRQAIRPNEVARGRRHAASRVFDDGDVVEEIATQLLALSRG
jgi:hypothetical protein